MSTSQFSYWYNAKTGTLEIDDTQAVRLPPWQRLAGTAEFDSKLGEQMRERIMRTLDDDGETIAGVEPLDAALVASVIAACLAGYSLWQGEWLAMAASVGMLYWTLAYRRLYKGEE